MSMGPWCHGAMGSCFFLGDKDMAFFGSQLWICHRLAGLICLQGWPKQSRNSLGWLSSGELTQQWKITIFNGKIHYKWPFSIAFCMFTRGYPLRICAKLSDLENTPRFFFGGGSHGTELGSEPAKPKEPQRMAHRSGRITGMIQVEIYGKCGFTMSYHPNMSVDFPWFSLEPSEPSLQYNRMVLGKKQNIPQTSSEVLWLRRALWHFDVAIGGSTVRPQEIHGCWWSVHHPRVALILTLTYVEQTKQCNLRQLLNWDSLLLAVWMLGRLLGRFELQRLQSGRIQSYQTQKHGQQSWSENSRCETEQMILRDVHVPSFDGLLDR